MGEAVKLRIRFSKLGKVRFTSHRDVARIWERALRRAGLPVAYSGGFSPRPRLSFGLALPTGGESTAEYLDVDLDADDSPVEITHLPGVLSEALPGGVDALAVALLEPGATSLQEAVTSCTWLLEVQGEEVSTLRELVERTLGATSLVVTRERKGKQVTDDLRPAIGALEVIAGADSGVTVSAELGVHPRSVRPAELVAAIDAGLTLNRVRRTHQWIERDGARMEPLPMPAQVPATSAPHAEARAS